MCQTHIKTIANVSQSDIRERVLNTPDCEHLLRTQ